MAIIQNSAIVQKLVDELELSPATEKIPTELAEKILPVFQVNDTAINFKESGELIEYQDNTINENDRTTVVPAGKVWKIKLASLIFTNAGAGNRYIAIQILNADGDVVFFSYNTAAVTTSSVTTVSFRDVPTTAWFVDPVGGTNQSGTITFPLDVPLPAGYGIRIFDMGTGVGTDDMVTTLLVNERDVF